MMLLLSVAFHGLFRGQQGAGGASPASGGDALPTRRVLAIGSPQAPSTPPLGAAPLRPAHSSPAVGSGAGAGTWRPHDDDDDDDGPTDGVELAAAAAAPAAPGRAEVEAAVAATLLLQERMLRRLIALENDAGIKALFVRRASALEDERKANPRAQALHVTTPQQRAPSPPDGGGDSGGASSASASSSSGSPESILATLDATSPQPPSASASAGLRQPAQAPPSTPSTTAELTKQRNREKASTLFAFSQQLAVEAQRLTALLADVSSLDMPLRAAVARRRDAVRDEGERLGRLLQDLAKTMQNDFAAVRAQQEWLSRVEALGIAGLVEAATAAPPPAAPKGRRRSTSRARAPSCPRRRRRRPAARRTCSAGARRGRRRRRRACALEVSTEPVRVV